MRPDLQSAAVKSFELLTTMITGKYPGAQAQIDSKAQPPTIELSYTGTAAEFQEFSDSMETLFKKMPMEFGSNQEQKTINVSFDDSDDVDVFLLDFIENQNAADSNIVQENAKKSLKGLIQQAGGKYSRHFKTILFSTKRKEFKGMLCVEVLHFDMDQAKRTTDLFRAVGLEPQVKKLTVWAILDTAVDYDSLFQERFKEFFPETKVQKSPAKKAAGKPEPEKKAPGKKSADSKKKDEKSTKKKSEKVKNKKAVPKKVAPKKAAPKKGPSKPKKAPLKSAPSKENPQLEIMYRFFGTLPPKDQKVFLLRCGTSSQNLEKVAAKLTEALLLLQKA